MFNNLPYLVERFEVKNVSLLKFFIKRFKSSRSLNEERAAHLLYFTIKDHPCSDGNKRIGCFLFLLYLHANGIRASINDNGLVAIALFVAESDPKHKDLLVRLVANLINNE